MTTQKFMGRNQLLNRLAAQVGSEDTARSILIKRGQMTTEGVLTATGKARDNMTAEERAKDRASKKTSIPEQNMTYDPRTNRATRRR
ncbi:MAG: hypothetical protein WCO52_06085 [bacterium]